MNAALLLFIALLNFSIGMSVYRRNPHAALNRAFAFTATTVALWATALAAARFDPTPYSVIVRLVFAIGSLVPLGVVAFVERFPGSAADPPKKGLSVVLPVALALSFLSFSPWMIRGVSREAYGTQAIYGPLHPLLAIYLLASFAYAGRTLLRRYRTASGHVRFQIRHVFLAFVIPGALVTSTNVIVPLLFKTSAYSWYGPFFSLIMLAMVGHAIIRHRLMDIRVVIRRSVVYLVAVLGSAVIFILLLFGSNLLLPSEQGFSVREILLALIVAVLFQPVKEQAQRLFDRYLYRDPYDYAATLRDASRALTATIDLRALLVHVGDVLGTTLRPEGIATYLLDPDDREFQLAWSAGSEPFPPALAATAPLLAVLTADRQLIFRDEIVSVQPPERRDRMLAELDHVRAEVVVPLLEENEVIGLLAIGAKRSGEPYFSNDADLLTTLANQAAVAVRNAQTHARVVQVNEEMQKILGTIESGVVAVGSRGRVTLFNRAAEQLTGTSAPVVRGRPADHLPAPLARALQATTADGQPRAHLEFALPDAAGQLIPLMCSTSPLRGPDGTTVGAVAVLSDMSRLKELEHEKQRAERLASIEAIASGLIHEIRNPLVGIKTYAQFLPSRGASAEFREMFSRTAAREIGRIDDLLSRFRTISRASQQSMSLVDVAGPIQDALETLHPQLEAREIRLRQVGEGSPRPVLGNTSQLQQLFLNLCLNAIEAMEPGGELTVRVADLSDGGGSTLLVEVADTGPGIAEDVLPSIFDPFVTTKAQGTGLGLAICRGIADAHHARLTVRNNVGRPGCTFTVKFPVPSARSARVVP